MIGPGRLRRLAGTAVDLVRGPVPRRHVARSMLAHRWNRPALNRLLERLDRREPGRPTIVVALLDHLGDLVAAEPIARHLKRTRPEARVLWVVGRRFRELVETNPHVDAVLPIGCTTEWTELARGGIPAEVVDLHVTGRSCGTCQRWHVREGDRSGIDITNYYHHGNLLEIFCKVAGLPILDDGPRVYVPERRRQAVDGLGLPGRFVAVHCRSNQAKRDWTDERWRALAGRIVDRLGLPVVEVGLRPVVAGAVPGCVDLCGRLAILETAEVIRRAALFVGIDSGPAHLANAVGTPGVVLLGHYGPYRRYLPYSGGYADGGNARLVRGDGPAAAIPVDAAMDAVLDRLDRGAPR